MWAMMYGPEERQATARESHWSFVSPTYSMGALAGFAGVLRRCVSRSHRSAKRSARDVTDRSRPRPRQCGRISGSGERYPNISVAFHSAPAGGVA